MPPVTCKDRDMNRAGRDKRHPVTNALCVLIPFLTAAAIFMVWRSRAEWPIADIDQGIVETYCRLIGNGQYGEAYDQCLSSAYRRQVSRDDFIRAQTATREARGVLQEREFVRAWSYFNLFTRVREFRLLYLLTYPDDQWRNYIVGDNADGEWRIEGTYRKEVDNLRYIVW